MRLYAECRQSHLEITPKGLERCQGGNEKSNGERELFEMQGNICCGNHMTNQHKHQNEVDPGVVYAKRHILYFVAKWHFALTIAEDGIQQSYVVQVTGEQWKWPR